MLEVVEHVNGCFKHTVVFYLIGLIIVVVIKMKTLNSLYPFIKSYFTILF